MTLRGAGQCRAALAGRADGRPCAGDGGVVQDFHVTWRNTVRHPGRPRCTASRTRRDRGRATGTWRGELAAGGGCCFAPSNGLRTCALASCGRAERSVRNFSVCANCRAVFYWRRAPAAPLGGPQSGVRGEQEASSAGARGRGRSKPRRRRKRLTMIHVRNGGGYGN